MSSIQKENLFSQIQESIEKKHEKAEVDQLKADDAIEGSGKTNEFIRVESLVCLKEIIAQALNSISFPLSHSVTENELFEIGANILQSFGIAVHEYPYAFSEFFIKKWKINFGKKENLQELIEEMLTMIEAARFSKIIIKEYFNFVRKTLNDFLTKVISQDEKNELLSIYSKSALEACRYLTQSNKDYILETHFRLVFEDNFAIGLAHACLNEYNNALINIPADSTLKIHNIINYIDKLIDIDELFKIQNDPCIKILIRGWLFKDLNCINTMPCSSMVKSIKKNIPILTDPDDFCLFSSVINSTAMKQAINLFIEDTLIKDNQLIQTGVDGKQKYYKAPFSSHDEGLKMIYEGFKWAMSSGKTFYAYLLNYAHGFSDDGYMFINLNYLHCDDFAISFRLLTLIHESFHLYKRIGKNENIKTYSLVNSFVMQFEEKIRPEDGARFENILIPNKGERFYFSGAQFLNNFANWEKPLEEFQKGFKLAQEEGNSNGEPSMSFSIQQSMDWPKCFRIPFFYS